MQSGWRWNGVIRLILKEKSKDMENFEINILIDTLKDLRVIRERINNINDDEYENLTSAVEKIDDAIELMEIGN